ncbi:MAG: redoxin domain-containing protein [Thalassolituus oleivorans]|uniref:redoxin domain-containing protein n=1 Tax=Thalassolituus oleivorans TaxID=187493 RepID=UPI001B5B68E8|nr:redoxin domain-containing protein [Thalassolituus oleivorans]MBQ0727682.1 redoxin domain-containing protein [Thalassolituus oleivorans]MBQ0779893.1 redoxin domain-containing protein [Thalassolituus oleivorans]
MNRLKSLFLSTWITLLAIGVIRGLWVLTQETEATVWYWAIFALASPLIFFAWIFLTNVARTAMASKATFAITLFAFIGALATSISTSEPLIWIIVVAVIGSALYEWWYSKFGDRSSAILTVGKVLPNLELMNTEGALIKTNELNKPLLLIFYRGNWCPLCMAQIKEVATQYRELAEKGVEIMLISPQPQGHTASLAQRFDAPMSFLVDHDNAMAKRLGIAALNGLPAGLEALGYDSDTVMPTVIMTDAHGKILFADLTDNYRVRPEPDVFLNVFTAAGI